MFLVFISLRLRDERERKKFEGKKVATNEFNGKTRAHPMQTGGMPFACDIS